MPAARWKPNQSNLGPPSPQAVFAARDRIHQRAACRNHGQPQQVENGYFSMLSSSTSKTRVAPGLIVGGLPWSP